LPSDLKVKGGRAPREIKYEITPTKGGTGHPSDTLTVKNRRFRSTYYTCFSSLEPRLLFSKLEQNNRILDSTGFEGKVSPLRLYQYQLWSFGATLNVFRFNFPQLKINWNVLGFGGYFFRTRIGTSTDGKDNGSLPLNASYLVLNSNVVFRPDNRWGVSVGFDCIKPSLWSNRYKLANDNLLLQPYLDAFLKTNESAKLFFRFRWIYEHDNRGSNFTQIQMGYSINLYTAGSDNK